MTLPLLRSLKREGRILDPFSVNFLGSSRDSRAVEIGPHECFEEMISGFVVNATTAVGRITFWPKRGPKIHHHRQAYSLRNLKMCLLKCLQTCQKTPHQHQKDSILRRDR